MAKKRKMPKDTNQRAKAIVDLATKSEHEKPVLRTLSLVDSAGQETHSVVLRPPVMVPGDSNIVREWRQEAPQT
jgi:hypothetical protein